LWGLKNINMNLSKVVTTIILISTVSGLLIGLSSAETKITQDGIYNDGQSFWYEGLTLDLNNQDLYNVAKLGIGTDSPQTELHVEGDVYFNQLSKADLADYTAYNSNGPKLNITKGYRSHNGLRLKIPDNQIKGNMSSSDWYDSSEATEPSSYEYRYFYALVDDASKIAVSNEAPSSENTKQISGEEFVYIGSARYYNNQYIPVKATGKEISFTGESRNLFGAGGSYGRGYELYVNGGTCSTDKNYDLSNYIPKTAEKVSGVFVTFAKVRCDSGCYSQINSRVTLDGDYVQRDRASYRINTPIDGNYYPVPHLETMHFSVDTGVYNLTDSRFYYSASNCYGDNWSGSGAALQSFVDRKIY